MLKPSTLQRENNTFAQVLEVFDQCNEIEGQTFKSSLIILQQKKQQQNQNQILNCYEILQNSLIDNMEMSEQQNKEFIKLINLLKDLIKNQININNYSGQIYDEARKQLIERIQIFPNFIEFLKFLVKLTAIDIQFIQCGSNSLCMLVEMRINLTQQNWEGVRIKNTILHDADFSNSNLSQSEFENVDISGINLDNAILFDCTWTQLKLAEFLHIDEHKQAPVTFVSFSPDGTKLAYATEGKIYFIIILNVMTGKIITKIKGFSKVLSLGFFPDGEKFFSNHDFSYTFIWNLQDQYPQDTLQGYNNDFVKISLSIDGNYLVTIGSDNSIALWYVKRCKVIKQFYGQYDIYSICISSKNQLIAAGYQLGQIHMLNFVTKKIIRKLIGHVYPITSLNFTPDGSTLASSSGEPYILLWNLKTGHQKHIIEHKQCVESVKFSPDGTTLASGGQDGQICIWNEKSGQLQQQLSGHFDKVSQVCFSPDGTGLTSGSLDGSILIWNIYPIKEYLNEIHKPQRKSKKQLFSAVRTKINPCKFQDFKDRDIFPLFQQKGSRVFIEKQ